MKMEEWKEYKLGDIATFKYGTMPKKDKISDNGLYPIFSGYRIVGYYDEYNLEKSELIIVARGVGGTGDAKLSPEKCFLTNLSIVVFLNENIISKKYAYYYFTLNNLRYLDSGSAQSQITISDLSKVSIKLPPLPIQQKIAAILSSLDDKIELNNKINTNLEQQAQALFKNWFVDFEPFGGKMPEGWKECKAEEYFEITIGKTPPRKEQEWFSEEKTNQTMKWVSISDMGSCGTFISDSSEYLTTDAVSKFNVKVVPANTILLSFKLTVGRIAITDDEMCTNEAIAHFGTKNKAINEYLFLYLKNFNYQTMGSTSSIATAVNSKIIKAMPFILPDEKTINDFHLATNSLFEKIRENQHENRTLSRIRDTLLPKLMNGEISIE